MVPGLVHMPAARLPSYTSRAGRRSPLERAQPSFHPHIVRSIDSLIVFVRGSRPDKPLAEMICGCDDGLQCYTVTGDVDAICIGRPSPRLRVCTARVCDPAECRTYPATTLFNRRRSHCNVPFFWLLENPAHLYVQHTRGLDAAYVLEGGDGTMLLLKGCAPDTIALSRLQDRLYALLRPARDTTYVIYRRMC